MKIKKEVQTKIISSNKIKPPLLKSTYNQEVKDGKIDNDEAKRIFKTLEDMESNEIDYSKLVNRSGDNKYFDFTRFGQLSSFYLKLVNGNIDINVAKLNMKEFENEIDGLKGKKAKKQLYKTNREDVLKNAKALHDGLNIVVDAFKRRVFEYGSRPDIDVDYASDTYGLTDKELSMFKKLFEYYDPYELRDALVDANNERYKEL